MNQKKCPKCGEMNPGEAVMCWACYTPLAGPAGAAGGAGAATMATSAVATHEDDEGQKKAIAPWQLGVVGVGLLLALGLGARTMMSTPGEDPSTDNTVPVVVRDPGNDRPNPNPPPVAPPGPSVPGGSTTSGTTVQPVPQPYTTVSSPNPKSELGVVGIVPTTPNISNQRAASLAAAAFQQFKNSGWKGMHIYVFADNQAGEMFSDYQLKRRSEPLQPEDYTQLNQLWGRCLARYEFNGVKASVRYPNQQPNGWWQRRS